MEDSCCEDCRFWDGKPEEKEAISTGNCRRRSPFLTEELQEDDDPKFAGLARWPLTISDDWCGEFEPHEKTKG